MQPPPIDNSATLMSLDELIRDVCSYLGDETASKLYIKVARVAKNVLHQLKLHASPVVKSIPIKVENNMTGLLPNDVEFITKVGVCCGGKIKLLGRKDDLCMPLDEKFFKCCTCDNEEATANEQGASCCDACRFHNIEGNAGFSFANAPFGVNVSPRYFYGSTPQMFTDLGYYRHDPASGVLVFSGGCDVNPGALVIAEYSSSMSVAEYQLIPRKWYFMVQHRIAHQIKANNNPNASELELKNFRMEYDMVKRTLHNYTLEDMVSALRGAYKSSPKR